MKRFFMLSILALAAAAMATAAIILLPAPALAAGEFVHLLVTGTNVNLRPQPRASGAVLAQANPNDVFIAEKATIAAADGSRWYKILFTLGPSGNFLSVADDPRFKGSSPYISAKFVRAKLLSSGDAERVASSGGALALKVLIRNDFDVKMTAAIIYCDAEAQNWRTSGWYAVEPHSERTLNFNAAKTDVYIHAQLEGLSETWGDGDITKTVIRDAFSYYDGEECPAGSERRDVRFTHYAAKNGTVDFRPEPSTQDSSQDTETADAEDDPAKDDPAKASADENPDVRGLWIEIPGLPEEESAIFNRAPDGEGEVYFERTINKDGLFAVSIERIYAKDSDGGAALTPADTGKLAARLAALRHEIKLREEDVDVTESIDELAELYTYPTSGAIYTSDENDDARANMDVFIFAGEWVFRVHFAIAGDISESKLKNLCEGLKFVNRSQDKGTAGGKRYPGYDVFDWNMKDRIVSEIIGTWGEHDEQVDEKFLDPENLIKAIDGYNGDWDQALIFYIASELAGVDMGPYEDAGAESYPGFDVFDWNRKDNIAAAIIATWEKYDEQVDEKFLDPENLTKAIDGYKGDWNQASMFRIACELAGVDFGSYEGREDD